MSQLLAAFALVSLVVSARPAPGDGVQPGAVTAEERARLVAVARRHVARPFRGDCSGFVRHVYAEAKVPLRIRAGGRSGTEAMVRSLAPTRRPRPGDLAYFHRTHDRERPGPGRNLYTHVGVVESVRGARISVVHKSNRGVERLRMDLARPADATANDHLRRKRASDPPGQKYLGSQLLAGFVSPSPLAAARPPVQARAAPPRR